MSPLDAGACPYLERVVEQEGAQTKQEIRAAVKRLLYRSLRPSIAILR